jgi:hypothetical protein
MGRLNPGSAVSERLNQSIPRVSVVNGCYPAWMNARLAASQANPL